MPDQAIPVSSRHPLFSPDGPIHPVIVDEAIRTLFCALPIDPGDEPEPWTQRRRWVAMQSLAALRPRDETELTLCVQALSASHAAAANWRLAMNSGYPRGANIRHVTAAGSAARTYDTLLRALERRQSKTLAPSPMPAEPRQWTMPDLGAEESYWRHRLGGTERSGPPAVWEEETVEETMRMIEADRHARENEGLDIENTEGILPDGSMIVPVDPDENQKAYLARRYGLEVRRQYRENLSRGVDELPKLPPVRPGDRVP